MSWFIRALAGVTVFSCAILSVRGDEPTLSREEKDAGFQLLFNGQDLSGWEEVQGTAGTFEVKDGVLTGRRKDKSAYWLSTKEEYGNFELRLEFKIPPKGNSGIFIRAPHEGRASQKGMEIQIYDEGDKKIPDESSTGSIYQVVPARRFAHRPPGEWNELWILCEGDRVKVTMNGELVNDALMSEYEALKDRPRKGYIGLSAHTDTVEFRNIRLRKITSDK
jgi:hypothetical protein